MKRAIVSGLVAGLVLWSIAADAIGATATADPVEEPEYVAGSIMVKFPSLLDVTTVRAVSSQAGVSELRYTPEDGWRRMKVEDGASAFDKVAALNRSVIVEAAARIWIGKVAAFPTTPPNDPRYPDQWGFPNTSVPQAWQIAGGGSSTHAIAIVDTGVDLDHPDLGTIGGQNFTMDGGTRDDICTGRAPYPNGHGTLVAGVAAAFTNNSTNMAGVAYNAEIWSLRVSTDCGGWDSGFAHDAIIWAMNQSKVWVISLSLEGAGLTNTERDYLGGAMDLAWDAGKTIVNAVGNGGTRGFGASFPGAYNKAIRVGGYMLRPIAGTNPVQRETRRWCFCIAGHEYDDDPYPPGSNWGSPGVHVVAPVAKCWNSNCTQPGDYVGVWSTKAGGGTVMGLGTSFAAPLVAGVAYLVKSRHPTWTPYQIRDRIRDTADERSSTATGGPYDYTWDLGICGGASEEIGCGVVNAADAVQ